MLALPKSYNVIINGKELMFHLISSVRNSHVYSVRPYPTALVVELKDKDLTDINSMREATKHIVTKRKLKV